MPDANELPRVFHLICTREELEWLSIGITGNASVLEQDVRMSFVHQQNLMAWYEKQTDPIAIANQVSDKLARLQGSVWCQHCNAWHNDLQDNNHSKGGN